MACDVEGGDWVGPGASQHPPDLVQEGGAERAGV